ncbi:MAG: RNase P subunit p30 family protein [Nanoarchaeota archaeon]
MTILHKDNFNKLKNKVKEAKSPIIFTSNDDELNRKVLEKLQIDILLINQKNRKDFQKQKNSGFNHVLAKITKKNNIQIGINLDEVVESNSKEKSKILARIQQNIKLCNKNKIQMQFIGKNKRNIYDLKSLGLVLGMPTWMTKRLQNINEHSARNQS